jgi:hypothetical protein
VHCWTHNNVIARFLPKSDLTDWCAYVLLDRFIIVACTRYTGARARRYNIAASLAILYCLAPGPRVSPHQLFYVEQERAIHTHTLSHSHPLFFFWSIYILLSLFLVLSFCFWLLLFLNQNDVCSTIKAKKKSWLLLGLNPGFSHDWWACNPLSHYGRMYRDTSFLALHKNDGRRQQSKNFKSNLCETAKLISFWRNTRMRLYRGPGVRR